MEEGKVLGGEYRYEQRVEEEEVVVVVEEEKVEEVMVVEEEEIKGIVGERKLM